MSVDCLTLWYPNRLWGALCVLTGDSILILLTIFGAASLLKTFPILFVILKIIGGAYLAYLGFRLLEGAYQAWNKPQQHAEMADLPQLDQVHPYRTALSISLLNPKAILFFLSFFVQFVEPDYVYPALSFLILAIILQLISFSYLTALIFSGIKLQLSLNITLNWQQVVFVWLASCFWFWS